ncbi:DUF2232 domain-containing protein [Romboutsia lituseburensis]|uniref:DUF2232 domain-containing protein n=1 Tax=Romboutsia lituseburensis TaxID=1537 RepID=UPI00215AF351|nr:DUF2232 domain-containing protein [Romboutsia lituseburensis]MCR8744734.1 DUF2232 domain-containing protein [Romboutsia lituseburensis]
MNNTKKMTEAGMLSALFIVSTILAVGSGFGYTIYLDFVVPVFFCIVLLKCDFKYTVLSGIVSLTIVGLVLGNIGTAIWASQSIMIGILCGCLMVKDTSIMDDLVYGSILGVILMVFIDIYASSLIGYSFMKEFRGYANMFPYKEYMDFIYYLFVSTFPFGTVFSIYYISLILVKKINILKGNSKKKFQVIRNFRSFSRFVCCSKKVFYGCCIYIIVLELLSIFNINLNGVYLSTILISIKYLCYYFVIRDGYITAQNYLMSKYQNVLYVRITSIISLVFLIFLFKVTTLAIILLNLILDINLNIRTKQISIINNYINALENK